MLQIIPKDHLQNVCKLGQGNLSCRYIIMHPDDGFCCCYKDRENFEHMTRSYRPINCGGIQN